jgi:hypothetical protein
MTPTRNEGFDTSVRTELKQLATNPFALRYRRARHDADSQ